jgi:pimeloyl-ACP methyl ester carboxylesterase
MHVAEAGAGDPLLLLHGWPEHWWAWRHVIPELAPSFHVLCADMRGFGWSSAPRHGYGVEQLTQDVVELLDELGLERVSVLGHDWGGFVGLLLALHHPERVRGCIALNTAQPFPPVNLRSLATFWRFWYQPLIGMPGVGPRLVGGGRQRFMQFLHSWNRDADAWSEADAELFLGSVREPPRARASSALYRTFLLALPGFLRGRYKSRRLRTPTLYLQGERDPVLRPAFVRGFEPYADDMALEFVPDCGHLMPEERPEVVVERALAFLPAG